MRLVGDNGKYSEKLDELLKYDLICIAYKDEQAYFYSQKTIQSKEYTGIRLTAIGKDELDQKLNDMGSLTQVSALQKENDFFRFEALDKKRQKHNLALQELAYKVWKLLFLCYGEEAAVANTNK
jgi:hypothetical protein